MADLKTLKYSYLINVTTCSMMRYNNGLPGIENNAQLKKKRLSKSI
jgi:hypothetical protein